MMDVDATKVATVKGRVSMIFEAYGYELTENDVRRFVVGSKGDVDESSKKLMAYCSWRQAAPQYGVPNGFADCCKEEHVIEEINSGKAYILEGYARNNQPVIMVHGRLHDSTSGNYDIEQTTRFTIYMLETAIKKLKDDIEKVTVVFDLENITMKAVDYKYLKRLIHILANYYPERMGNCLIYNAPAFFSGCWALISPWIDRDTAQKVRFLSGKDKLTEFISEEIMPRCMGGASKVEYIADQVLAK